MTPYRVDGIFGDGTAFEKLWDIDLKAIPSKVVGKDSELNELVNRDEQKLEAAERR
jgi:hypothetical protein